MLVGLLTAAALAWTGPTETTLLADALGATVLAPEGAAAPDPTTPQRVRRAIDAWARQSAPEDWKKAWNARFPTPESYDAWAAKDALGLNVTAQVVGFDTVEAKPWDLASCLAPTRDGRHTPIVGHGQDRRPIILADGREVPADPAVFLSLRPSMADVSPIEIVGPMQVPLGHAGRLEAALGGPVAVGFRDVDLSQTFADLAVLAATDDAPDPAAARMYLSQSQHYLLEAADPLICVECGLHAYSGDAFKNGLFRSVVTAGGYLGRVRPPPEVGLELMMSRRSLARGFVDLAIADPASEDGKRLRGAIADGDIVSHKQLADGLKRAGDPPERTAYAEIAAKWLVGVVEFDTVKLWRHLRLLADEGPGVPAVARPRGDIPEVYQALLDEYEGSLRRAGVSMRASEKHTGALITASARSIEERAAVREIVLRRVVGWQVKYLAEREQRRADYIAAPPAAESDGVRAPEILVGELCVLVLLGALVGGAAVIRRQRAARGDMF